MYIILDEAHLMLTKEGVWWLGKANWPNLKAITYCIQDIKK
jgi:hypothetical protein